ncbi:hypothetical protein SNE40_011128 [Patella caerulea]|uniref:Uncharacterized protein n=1 Tax=Patella caerulea TaxID=87958 RepID=A0AAN8Q0Y9_PATCE
MKVVYITITCVIICQSASVSKSEGSPSTCISCYYFADKNLGQILNVIMNTGIVGDCSGLCSYLPSKKQQAACNNYCQQSAGISNFVKAATQCDLDSVYFCELINQCDFIPNGDATIKTAQVSRTNQVKDKASLSVTIDTTRGTGAGEILVELQTADKIPTGIHFPVTSTSPGEHHYTIPIDTGVNSTCNQRNICTHSTTYTITISVCSCACGSHHDRSQVYDMKKHSFTLGEYDRL